MWYVIAAVLGMLGGMICVFLALGSKRKSIEEKQRQLAEQIEEKQRQLAAEIEAKRREHAAQAQRLRQALQAIEAKKQKVNEVVAAEKRKLDEQAARLKEERQQFERATACSKEDLKKQVAQENMKLEEAWAGLRREEDDAARLKREYEGLKAHAERELAARLQAMQDEFEDKKVSYKELQDENAILKRDLRNIDVSVRKLQLDRDLQQKNQETLDQRGKGVGSRYLKESVKWVGESLTQNNFVNCKQRLLDVIERCRGIGFEISKEEEAALLADLKQEYEKVVRAAFEREEQTRIKAQIREEQLREKEIERELKQLEREREAIRAALDKALAEAKDEHSAEVERLKARLAEAEEKSQRAISQAQLTKSGHVYVISNIGSFGEGVFKIGMTRRLEPMDRVKELGDASVPFPFDVHMMISSNDAPTLENALHGVLHKSRLNKINPKKEFFRSDIETIRKIVQEHHGEVQYLADPEALQYRQSQVVSDEDEEFIEAVYEKLDEEEDAKGATPDD